MEFILSFATILGGITAIWFFWDKLKPNKPKRLTNSEKVILVHFSVRSIYSQHNLYAFKLSFPELFDLYKYAMGYQTVESIPKLA